MGRARVLLQDHPDLEVRILVVLASADYKAYYIPLMNTIFSAEHLKVCIDCINVSAHGSKFMQQACHQTGGTYQHLDGEPKRDRAGILQHMLYHFLPSRALRKTLMDSASVQDVDLRASCFHDGSECEVGIVCTICLSIFSVSNYSSNRKYFETCPTCGTLFFRRGNRKLGKKKKKKRKSEGAGASGSSSGGAQSKKLRPAG
jgi:transcription initiation factor TFIIH subunit 3